MSFFSIKTASKLSSSTSKGVCMCVVALGPRSWGSTLFLMERAEERTPCPKAVGWVLDVGFQAAQAHK